jgi:hypothetical protein
LVARDRSAQESGFVERVCSGRVPGDLVPDGYWVGLLSDDHSDVHSDDHSGLVAQLARLALGDCLVVAPAGASFRDDSSPVDSAS